MTALLDPDKDALEAVKGSAESRRHLLQRARKPLLQILAFAVAVVLAKILFAILDKHDVVKASTPLPVILLGTIIGLTYGLLAVGIVLIYRTNRIINFAHGQIGAFGSAFFGVAAVKWHIPYWVAFPIALIVAAATGAAAETGVVRRLRNAPRLMSMVATLGVGQFLVIFAAIINSTASAGALYPQPSWLPAFNVGALRVTPAYSGMLILSPLFVLAIALFLKRSRFGLAIRAAAANPEAARMSGIFASRMSTLAWAIAGALSAFTAILTAPTQGFISGDSFGPALLLRAMTAAVIGRMQSLPIALAAGVGLGILEQLLLWNYPQSGLVEVTMFVVILVTLLLQRKRGGRDEEKGSWAAVQGLRPIPDKLQDLWAVRALGPIVTIVIITVLAILPLFITNSLSVTFTGIIAFAIVGLSIGVLTGLGGQLTLGQFAVAAIGAVVSYQVSSRIGDFPLALFLAGLGAGLVSVVIGLPALRIRGLMLTVTTLGFALAAPAWLLTQPWMLGDGRDPGRPIGLTGPLDTGRWYYYFALVLFVLSLVLARNIRRSGFRRLLVAIRDNEDNARAFAVRASLVKLQGYLIGGFIAGIGGATYGHSLSTISAGTFPASASIDVVVMTVLGGVSALIGPVLGAVWVLGLPLLNIGNIGLAATKFGALLLILWKPGGLIQIVAPVRDWIVKFIARRHGIDPEPLFAGDDTADTTATAEGVSVGALRVSEPDAVASGRSAPSPGTTLLEARQLQQELRRRTRRARRVLRRTCRRDGRPHRSERCRQDDDLRDARRLHPAGHGPGVLRPSRHQQCRAGGAGAARPDPVVPGCRAVPDDDRERDGHARARAGTADRLPHVNAGRDTRRAGKGAAGARPGFRDGSGSLSGQADPGAVDRHPPHHRDRLPRGAAAYVLAARRAVQRRRPARDRSARAPARRSQARTRPDARRHRARHPAHHGDLGSHHRDGRRKYHRRRPAGRRAHRPASRRRLPRRQHYRDRALRRRPARSAALATPRW